MDLVDGKELLKIMWVSDHESALFRMKDNSPVPKDSAIYTLIAQHTGVEEWAIRFGDSYRRWLNEDDATMYDLRAPLQAGILARIAEVNAEPRHAFRLFYWYDVEPSADVDHVWERSPLSGEGLLDLGRSYNHLNRMISLRDHLVFPGREPAL